MKKVIVILIIMIVLSACMPSTEGIRTSTDNVSDYVQRYIDSEMGVVCYTYLSHSISCVAMP